MKLYLAPEPSLALIRYLRSTSGDDGLTGSPKRKRALNDAIHSARHISELDETAQRLLSHVEEPIHAYVADKSDGTVTKRLVTHMLSGPIPNGAFLDIGHDICICTPQFAFMQMATTLDLLDAIAVGMELCGYYSRWRLEPNVMGNPYYFEHTETQTCTFNLPQALHQSQLKAFVERQAGHRGAVNSRAALRWVIDGAASPMETAVYLLLCLPKRLGGYGLPKPILNPKLTISNPGGVKERYPDLYWSKGSIDVEYNSDSAHSGEWARYRDSKREVEFAVANVKVLPLTRHQLMDAEEFDSFAQGLRRMLGIRTRPFDHAWRYRRDELRRNLAKRWSP